MITPVSLNMIMTYLFVNHFVYDTDSHLLITGLKLDCSENSDSVQYQNSVILVIYITKAPIRSFVQMGPILLQLVQKREAGHKPISLCYN